jgi:hypothetical protein
VKGQGLDSHAICLESSEISKIEKYSPIPIVCASAKVLDQIL